MGFKHALTSAYKRAFRSKPRKLVAAGIALVGTVLGVSIAFAADPGATSRVDYAMNFDGSSTYLTSTQQIVPATGDFTVESYAKFSVSNNSNGWIWSTGTAGGATSGLFGLAFRNGGVSTDGTCLVIIDGSANSNCLPFAARLPFDDWIHVSVVYTSSNNKYTVYLNATPVTTATRVVTTIPAGFSVGRNAVASTDSNLWSTYFMGSIDEVKVFDTTRTQGNISADAYDYLPSTTSGLRAEYDFNEGSAGNGKIYDRTTNNFDLTVNGTATYSDIAQVVTAASTRTGNTTMKFGRSYLTSVGGWTIPGGVSTLVGSVYGGGAGGGGGASNFSVTNNPGGGGGGSGTRNPVSLSVSPSTLVPVKVGLGGIGGLGQSVTLSTKAASGSSGGTTLISSSTAIGGTGGFGAGYASGTATYTNTLGGKGGNSSTAGSTVTSIADGGGGAGYGSVGSNSSTAGATITEPYIGGAYQKGGTGGQAQNTTYAGLAPTAATGSGGGGGKGNDGGNDGYGGFGGSAGAVVLQFSTAATTQDGDFLYNFNGSTQYAEVPATSSALNLTGDFTLEAWVKPTTNCASAYCVIAGRDNNYLLGVSNGTYRWQVSTSSGVSTWYDTGVAISLGQWQHVALVRSGVSVLFYLNGQLMTTQNNADTDASGLTIALTATSQVGFGWFELAARGAEHSDMFTGGIDDVRVWNTVRTAVAIGDPATGDFNRSLSATTELNSATLVAYWDMNDTPSRGVWMSKKSGAIYTTDLTYFGAPTYVTNGAGVAVENRYLKLDKNNSQSAYAPDSSAFELTGGNFTISGWWQLTSCGNGNYLVMKGNSYSILADQNCKINVALDPGNDGDAATWQWMNTDFALTTNAWHYVSVIKVSQTLYTYVDSVLVSTINDGDTVPTLGNAGTVTALVPINLGNRSSYFGIGSTGGDSTRANFATENVDDIRLWSTDRRTNQKLDMGGFVNRNIFGLQAMFDFNALSATNTVIPNLVAGASSDSHLNLYGSSLSSAYSGVASEQVPNQPKRSQALIQRTIILSATATGWIDPGASSLEYIVAGGAGGGGTGGNSGYSGAGGGAGGLLEGTISNLPTGTSAQTVTTQKVGVGGRYAINVGDTVPTTKAALNGSASSFISTGISTSAVGGGAGGSGASSPANAAQGLAGAAGGGSGQGGGAGGTSTNGFAGGAGSSAAAGGGGGSRTSGSDASSGTGGSGGQGFLLPLAPSTGLAPTWVSAGGSGFGSAGTANNNSAYGSTAASADGTLASGGGGSGFATASSGTARGGFGGNGFILLNEFMNQPFVDQAPTTVLSGVAWTTPLSISLRGANGAIQNATDSIVITGSGCTVTNGTSTAAVAGVLLKGSLYVTSSLGGNCVLTITDSTSGGSTTVTVNVLTTPTSLTIGTGATTSGCAFYSGYLSCPNAPANINVSSLSTLLNTTDAVYLSSSGAITQNADSPISGSQGSLSFNAGSTVTLGAGISLTGQSKDLTVRTRADIKTNDAATSGSPTTFSTSGGGIYFYSASVDGNNATIKISNYNRINTDGGAFTASGGADPTVGYATGATNASGAMVSESGIYFDTGASVSTGAGAITLRGKYGTNITSYANPTGSGVEFAGSNTLATTSGKITIVGTGLPSSASVDQATRQGIRMTTTTLSTDSGDISLDGQSQETWSIYSIGMRINGSTISSNSGNISLTYSTPINASSGINFESAQTTIGSGTGSVQISSTQTSSSSWSMFDYLTLTGGGVQTISAYYPLFGSTPHFKALGSGDFVMTSPTGSSFYQGLTVSAALDFGTAYKTITLGDANAGTQVSVAANLQASQYVYLKGAAVLGSGAVIAPGLAIRCTSNSTTPTCGMSGANDVDTLAIVSATTDTTTAKPNMTLPDADGWTPGTVAGLVGVYGVPTKLSAVTAASSTNPRNAPFTTQPTVAIADAYGIQVPSADLLASGYAITPAVTAAPSSLTGITTVTTGANGRATFVGLTPTVTGAATIRYSSSPVLTPLDQSFTVAASSGTKTKMLLTAGSTSGTSGVDFVVQPQITFKDSWDNVESVGSSVTPTAAITSSPAGSTPTLTGAMASSSGGISNVSATKFKITGPSGNYVITYTAGSLTVTQSVLLSAWSITYGTTTIGYSGASTYPVTFTGAGTGSVTYSSNNTANCTVDLNTGALTVKNYTGSCTITGTQLADANYSGGSASVILTLTKGTQATVTVSASPTTLVWGSSVTLSGGGGSSSINTYTYTKVSSKCSISGATLYAATADAGDVCTVTATKTGDSFYNATTSANFSITIAPAAQAAVTVPTGKTVGYGNATDLTQAPYTPSGGTGTGVWSFSTSSANCSISGNLLTSTTAVGGTCVVAVQRLAQGNYADSTPVNMTLTTAKGSQTISYNTVTSSPRVGDTDTLNATSSSGLAVSYAVASGSSAYCSLQGATVTFNAPGSCVINVTQSGDANYNAATLTPITYTVAKGLQTITFTAISDDVVRTTTLSLGATSSSTLAITYAVAAGTTNSACTVTSTGVVTLSAVGVCSITASQAGNANYEAATDVTQTFNVAKGSQSALTITSANNPQYGQTVALTASGGNGSASYSFAVVSGPCSIASGTTSLILGDAGTTCVISVDRAGDANWDAATTATQTVTTTKAAQATLNITNQNAVVYGNQVALTYGGGSGNGAVTWSVNSPCSISGTTLSVGDAGVGCTLSLSKDGDDNYLPASATLNISVTRASQAPVTITSGNHYTYRQSLTLSATGGSGSGAITFAATGDCSVSGGNLLSGGGAGSSCSVIATRAQSTNYNAESSSSMTITIDKANQTISPVTVLGAPRALGTVNLIANSDSNLTVDLTIDNGSTAICTISGRIVSFLKAGDCVVNADQAGDTNFNAATQLQTTLTAAHASQTINLTNPGLKRYLDPNFYITGSTSSSLGITYSLGAGTTGYGQSSQVCAVSQQGEVQIGEVGTCQILANQAGDDVYDPATQVSLNITIAKALQTTLSLSSADTYVYGTTLQLTATGGDGNGAVSFVGGPSQQCSIDPATNIISGGDAGSGCNVRIVKAGDDHFEATQTGLLPITITQASQSVNITSTPVNPTALGTYTLTASSDSGDTITYSVPWTTTVCSVSGDVVTFLTQGTCIVQADQVGNTNYLPAQYDQQGIGVAYATQTLNWTTPTGVTFGDLPFQLQASASSGLNLVYLYTPGGACSISSVGEVTIVGAGACDIHIGQPGNATYADSGVQHISFNVAKAQQASLTESSITSTPYGDNVYLHALGGSGTGSVSYEARGTCTINQNLMIPGDAGTLCEVRAIQDADNDYEIAYSPWVTIEITRAFQQTLLISSSGTVTYGNTISLTTVGGSGPNPTTFVTTGTCSVTGSTLTPGDAGSTCTVKAVNAISTNYYAAESPTQTITVAKANQSINFTSSASQAVALGTYHVTASADSGDTVAFSISMGSSTVCTINGSTVSFLTGGTCLINADQAGNSNYNQAFTVFQTVFVAQAPQTITFTPAGVKHFGDSSFSASATTTSGLTILYGLGAGTTNGSCLVASDGTVTIMDVGTCEVTADQIGDSTYAAAARATQSITIAKGTQQALSISSANYVTYGQTQTLTTSGGSGQGSVSYDASGDCTESSGVLTVGAVGSNCQVRATKAADSQYQAITSPWLTVSVIKAHQATLTISSANSVVYGSTLALAVSGGSGPSSVTYTTTGTCSVTNGILSVGVVGSSCSVIATNAESANYLVASSQPQTVSVVKAANLIHLNPLSTPVAALDTYSVDVSADSGDPVVVTIDASTSSVCTAAAGIVTFVTSGSCVINLNEDGNSNFNAATQVQETVSVGLAMQAIAFNAAGVKHYGDPTFQASAYSNSNLPITYSIGPGTTNNACSVASDGTVTILDVGDCEVSADQTGNNVYSAAGTAGQMIPILKGTQAALTMSSASSVAYGTAFTLATSGGSGSGAVTFATTGQCTQSSGILTVGTVGSLCRVRATKAADSRYNAITSVYQTITVIRGPQAALTISSASNVAYDSSITLTTSGGSGNGAVTYMSGGNCYVSYGVLYPGAAGVPCVVRAHKDGDSNFTSIDSADFTVTVDKADQTISVLGFAVNPVAHDYYSPFVTASSNLNVDVSVDPSSSSVCSYGHGGIYFDTAGDCVINYNQAGDSNYNAAPQVQETVTVAKLTQTISTTQIGLKHYGDSAFQITSSSDSGLPLTFTQDANTTSGACTVSSTGYVTILAPGTCAWITSQSGDASYLSTTTNVLWFSIDKAQQSSTTLVLSSTTAPAGGTITMSVTGGSGSGSIRYVVSGTCTVSGNTLTVGNAGSQCTVYGIKEYDDYYAAQATIQETITVTRATQAPLTIDSTDTVVYGNTITLSTTGGSGSGLVSYTTTGTCTVSNGILTVGDAGSSCTVTATKAQSANFNAANSAAQTITITRASQTISITSSPTSPTALDTYVVQAAATSGLSVDVSIDNSTSSACSVSGSTVTFLTSGSCVINTNQSGGTNFTAASQVQQTVMVAKKAQASYLTIPSVSGNRQLGDADFSVSGSADSALAVTYGIGSSTTNNSCSINSSTGLVRILDVGECYITVNQGGNATWAVASAATGHFTIGKATQTPLVIASSATVVYGTVGNLYTTGGSVNGLVTYTTTGTCTVQTASLFVTDAGSACTVTAHLDGNDQYLPVDSATQVITVARADQQAFGLTNSGNFFHGQTLTLQTGGGSGDGAVSYAISGDCTLVGDELTLGNASSVCLVTASKAQSLNYNAISDQTRTISIGKAGQTISITSTPSNPTALDTYTFAATASSGAAVTATIDSASSSVCSILNNVVTYLTSGSCVINANQGGNANFNPATTVTQTISVARAMDIITIPTLADRTVFSTNLTVSATSLSNVQLTYTSVPQAGNVFNCSITTSGTLTLITPGRCEIEVTHPDGSVYAAATNTARFMITRGEQATLSMTSASSVDYLGSIQLAASGGSGTGAISYTANGACAITNGVLTVADVGSSCSVTATRAGDTNYNAVTSATQTITVNQISQDAIIVVSAAHVRYGQQLPLVSAGGSGPGAETWSIDTTSVSNSAGCAINSNTLNLSVTTSGACDVLVTKAASRNYRSEVSPRFSITVDKAYQSVAFTSTVPTAPVSGDTYAVAATSSAGLSVSYSVTSASAAYCSISGAVVSFTGTGDCEIVASQAGDGRYLAAPDASQTIAVGSLNQVITASNVRNHTYGDPAFVVVGETTSSSPVTFSLGSNTTANSCSVTSSGVVTILAVGHCELVLSAAADAQYAAASDITKSFEIVADQASAPFITSVSADNQSVTLSYLAPSYIGGSAIRAYGINAYLNGVLAASYSGCAANQTSCTMTGLTNGLAYTFRMVAVNAAGDGVESSATGAVTPVTHAEAVRQLVAVGVNTALDVTWAAPASLGGGTFDSYRIYVRPRGGSYPSTPTEVIYSSSATSKQLTGLVNGTSYDVKVVTITTANTVQLVSNTAEVLQYPKTIPDAPQSVSLAPVGATGLVVSWTAPISDGGDAIATYAAQVIGGNQCSVSATTNACEVSGLVDGATYRVSVVATNGAGTSPATEAQIVFHAATIAGANQANQGSQSSSGGGSSGPSNPIIVIGGTTGDQVHGEVWISLDKIATARANGMADGVSVSGALGGKLIFKGKGLGLIYSAYIGNHIPVKILSASNEQVIVQLPASKLGGWQDMWFFTDSHAIRYVDVAQYVVAKAPIVKILSGFKQNAKTLTQFQKGQLWKIVKQVGTFKQVDCKGSSTAAVATCKALKVKRPWVKIHVTKVKISHATVATKRVTLTFTK